MVLGHRRRPQEAPLTLFALCLQFLLPPGFGLRGGFQADLGYSQVKQPVLFSPTQLPPLSLQNGQGGTLGQLAEQGDGRRTRTQERGSQGAGPPQAQRPGPQPAQGLRMEPVFTPRAACPQGVSSALGSPGARWEVTRFNLRGVTSTQCCQLLEQRRDLTTVDDLSKGQNQCNQPTVLLLKEFRGAVHTFPQTGNSLISAVGKFYKMGLSSASLSI